MSYLHQHTLPDTFCPPPLGKSVRIPDVSTHLQEVSHAAAIILAQLAAQLTQLQQTLTLQPCSLAASLEVLLPETGRTPRHSHTQAAAWGAVEGKPTGWS